LEIQLTEILTIAKRNIWLITSHSSHHWILCLARNMMNCLVDIEYQNFTRIHIEEIILQVLILFEESIFFINMSNILTAVKEGTQSYRDKVYPRSSFNHMWILKYWIFWIIVIVVLFQKFRLSLLHFAAHSPWECLTTFQNIIKNAVIFKMVRNATNW
jgi:hypothetical protein